MYRKLSRRQQEARSRTRSRIRPYFDTPFAFSNVLKPPIPSRPVMTTQRRSRFSDGGAGHPLMAANHAKSGCKIVA